MKNLNSNEINFVKNIFKDHESDNHFESHVIEDVTNDFEIFAHKIASSFSLYEQEVSKDCVNINDWLILALISLKKTYCFKCNIKNEDYTLKDFLNWIKDLI